METIDEHLHVGRSKLTAVLLESNKRSETCSIFATPASACDTAGTPLMLFTDEYILQPQPHHAFIVNSKELRQYSGGPT